MILHDFLYEFNWFYTVFILSLFVFSVVFVGFTALVGFSVPQGPATESPMSLCAGGKRNPTKTKKPIKTHEKPTINQQQRNKTNNNQINNRIRQKIGPISTHKPSGIEYITTNLPQWLQNPSLRVS